jgi:hypothetical protein
LIRIHIVSNPNGKENQSKHPSPKRTSVIDEHENKGKVK